MDDKINEEYYKLSERFPENNKEKEKYLKQLDIARRRNGHTGWLNLISGREISDSTRESKEKKGQIFLDTYKYNEKKGHFYVTAGDQGGSESSLVIEAFKILNGLKNPEIKFIFPVLYFSDKSDT